MFRRRPSVGDANSVQRPTRELTIATTDTAAGADASVYIARRA